MWSIIDQSENNQLFAEFKLGELAEGEITNLNANERFLPVE